MVPYIYYQCLIFQNRYYRSNSCIVNLYMRAKIEALNNVNSFFWNISQKEEDIRAKKYIEVITVQAKMALQYFIQNCYTQLKYYMQIS